MFRRLFHLEPPKEVSIVGKVTGVVSNFYWGGVYLLVETSEGKIIQEPIDIDLGNAVLKNLFLDKTITINRMSDETTQLKHIQKKETKR